MKTEPDAWKSGFILGVLEIYKMMRPEVTDVIEEAEGYLREITGDYSKESSVKDVTKMKWWHPIKTVPKDIGPVLLCRAKDLEGNIIKQSSDLGYYTQVASWSELEGKWFLHHSTRPGMQLPFLDFEPTHWAYIPLSPYVEGE